MFSLVVGVSLAIWALGAHAYPSFSGTIPNGDRVPHPCIQGETWKGVGHENPKGGGARNQFGLDLKNAEYKWPALCSLDSDGDGRTNGEELGDPSCVWTPGSQPERTVDITHPGVCDLYNSPKCLASNTFLKCDNKTVMGSCQTIKKPETRILDLRFPPTEVPNSETNYFCMTFDLPTDQNYHIKAYEAIKDNMNVLHHILVFGCEASTHPVSQAPGKCEMTEDECNAVIGLWAVGVDGKCYDEDIGFPMGNTSFTRVKLEIHWNNPTKHAGWTDSSGMRFYYQPARPEVQDMMSLMTGQRLLEIPPRNPHVKITSTCSSDCTHGIITKPAYVVTAINHMHYLGKEMYIQVFRNGKHIKDLTNDNKYNYDSPTDVSFDPHFQVLPGDEIKTTCVFNSINRDVWTYWGEGTSDEMCFGFIMMYPRDAFVTPYCTSHGPLDICELYGGANIGRCNWAVFTNLTHPDTRPIVEELEKNCNLDDFCRPECIEISKRLKQHPCLNGEAAMTTKYLLQLRMDGLKFLSRINSCHKDGQQECKECECDHDHGDNYVSDSATGNTPFTAAIMSLVAMTTAVCLNRIHFLAKF